MDVASLVKLVDPYDDLSCIKLCLLLGEMSIRLEYLVHFAALNERHHEVQS